VPPHLRNRKVQKYFLFYQIHNIIKPEVSKPDKKRELTEDEKDRQKVNLPFHGFNKRANKLPFSTSWSMNHGFRTGKEKEKQWH